MSTIQIPELKRYQQQAKWPDGKMQGGFVDWFVDDADAAATTRVVLEQQGYKVKNVTAENLTVTAELE
jgi:hypothetical protein